MFRVVIVGAAGRMGRRLVANVLDAADCELAGATEIVGSPFLGSDAGELAGCGHCGVAVGDDLAAAVKNADVVINFSTGGVIEATRTATSAGCAAVIGTTALEDGEKRQLRQMADQGARIVFAPNMSVGVNLLFHLCREVAGILGEDYDIEVIEMHHNQKKDAPSGTAVRLAEVICEAHDWEYDEVVRNGRAGLVGARTRNEIGMHALRGGDVVGDHTVIFATGGERLELTHKASSRDTFARGALRAARFLMTAEAGLYDMQDVLNLRERK
ncbi:4-hydroxy-tetrahydrodipicolinate reductase [Victivallis sp. Marseille-Q1083]|uniref:4-hydroxy-tetrahydrodipicolinate reductase n=1 Tax=Victivallis sp. Marseille-Q1083 TaxID=2717288 RepID=UPI00158F6351|nr:4-hydroxy-tetrahydrodipicolinate reductase [Victivallis sp. Marseille-Q1083]